jgi:nitrite reductase (NADH) small subunit
MRDDMMTNAFSVQWVPACSLHDLVADSGIAVWTEFGPVAIYWLPDTETQYFAIGHHDPASGANVLARGIVGDIKDEPVVASPIYKHHYSLITGICIENNALTVPVFALREHNGQLELGLAQATE